MNRALILTGLLSLTGCIANLSESQLEIIAASRSTGTDYEYVYRLDVDGHEHLYHTDKKLHIGDKLELILVNADTAIPVTRAEVDDEGEFRQVMVDHEPK